jgi:hypothetical protein
MRWGPATNAGIAAGIALSAVTLVILAASLLAAAVNRVTPIEAWQEFLGVGQEGNLPTWWNASLLFTVAVSAVVASMLSDGDKSPRRAWWIVAGAATYMSLDETASLHERLGDGIERTPIGPHTYGWLLPGIFVAAAGVTVLLFAGRHLPRASAPRLGAALACYGAGAVGVEGINGWLDARDVPFAVAIGTTVEEALEMGASVFAVTVIVDSLHVKRTSGGIIATVR